MKAIQIDPLWGWHRFSVRSVGSLERISERVALEETIKAWCRAEFGPDDHRHGWAFSIGAFWIETVPGATAFKLRWC